MAYIYDNDRVSLTFRGRETRRGAVGSRSTGCTLADITQSCGGSVRPRGTG